MKTWPIQQARNNLCHIVKAAEQGKPQELTRHGRSVAVVISIKEYNALVGRNKMTVANLIQRSKGVNVELDVRRSRNFPRSNGFLSVIS